MKLEVLEVVPVVLPVPEIEPVKIELTSTGLEVATVIITSVLAIFVVILAVVFYLKFWHQTVVEIQQSEDDD